MDKKYLIITTRKAYTVQKVGSQFVVTQVNTDTFRGVLGLIVGFTTDDVPLRNRQPANTWHAIIEQWQPSLRNAVRMQFVLVREEALTAATQQALDTTSVVISEKIESIRPLDGQSSSPVQFDLKSYRNVA